MGIVRAWLAILIVLHHARQFDLPYSRAFTLVDSEIGFHVTLFILISGFYIQRSIEKLRATHPRWLGPFYLRRFFRIFPGYYLMLALYILCFTAIPTLAHFFPFPVLSWEKIRDVSSASPLFWANNFFLLFSTQNFLAGLSPLFPSLSIFDSLIVTQAWSLSVELFCYLVAPFLLTRKTWQLIAAFLIASAFGYWWQPSPFNQTMIVHQLPFFLYGALLYRLYRYLPSSQWLFSKCAGWIALCIVAVVSVAILIPGWANGYEQRALIVGLLLCGLCLPSVAQLTSGWTYDRLLGEMSYPIYLSHILCFLLAYQSGVPAIWVLPFSCLLSLAYALVTVLFYERPVRRLARKL